MHTMSDYVYLDHNATTLARPEAVQAVADVLAAGGNPSSVHGPGRAARRTMEQARRDVAALLNADPSDVIFTSGGTEANNLALEGSGRPRRLISAVEHSSVLAGGGEIIPVDGNGIVDLDRLEERLLADDIPALVSVMLANNETGVIAPVRDVVAIAHRHGALVHCDAIQAAGKIAVDMVSLGVDMMTMSAHKIGGPTGAGALIVRGIGTTAGAELSGMQFGGGQERGYRAGTENLVGISGLGAAAAAAHAGLQEFARVADLREAIEQGVKNINPRAIIMGEGVARLPNTTCLTMPGVDSQTQVIAFDLCGVGISAGSACSSGKTKTSSVLKAMNLCDEVAGCAVRVSLGWSSTAKDVTTFLTAWNDLHERQATKEILSPAA